MINAMKNNLLSLPDSIFFDIMRNYLGDLKTPFNKHDLMRSLTSMIMKKEIRTRIFDLIDDEDAKLLTSVSLLQSPTISELFEFTKNFFSFLELYNRVENLQQRLLLCIEYPEKSSEKDEKVIKLNPLFELELKENILNSSLVFPSSNRADSGSRQPWYNEQLLSGFISFLSANKNLLKESGNARKKAETKFSDVFSSVSNNLPENIQLTQLLIHTITSLGFAEVSELSLIINYDAIKTFENFDYKARMLKIAVAAVLYRLQDYEPEKLPTAEAVYGILASLVLSFSPGTTISREDFSLVLYLIKRHLKQAHPDVSLISGRAVIETLCLIGYLTETEDSMMFNFDPDKVPEDREKLRIQSNSEISAPAGFPLAKEITAALCSEISSYDITRTYSIEKKSFASALESGLSLYEIISTLEESSSGSIPQNILFSFKAWEKEFRSISLNYGIVMTVSADRLPLIKHAPSLKEFFLAAPAPGVFILDPKRENEWRRAFAEAGFDILPGIVSDEYQATPQAEVALQSFQRQQKTAAEPALIEFYGKRTDDKRTAVAIMEELTGRINKLPISAEKKNKLTARSQKKLILTDSQLKASDRPEERGEAGGLDHRAKIRLTERALELENLLEVTTAKDLDLEKRLIKPLKLVKADNIPEGKPPVFIINGIELPEEIEVQIPITRISYLKMLKSSLYTP
jgi:hypothetical protein